MVATMTKKNSVEVGNAALAKAIGEGLGLVLFYRGYSDRVRLGVVEGIDADLREISGGDLSKIDLRKLERTHVILGNGIDHGLSNEDLFFRLQGENWSPNGEANGLVESLGLWHTSMAIGDLVLRPDPEDRDGGNRRRYLVFAVDSVGFRCLGSIRPGNGLYPL